MEGGDEVEVSVFEILLGLFNHAIRSDLSIAVYNDTSGRPEKPNPIRLCYPINYKMTSK